MLDNVMAQIRKPLSIAMAALLATLLVPVVPGTSAKALAEDAPASDPNFITTVDASTGLITSGIWNNHAGASGVAFNQAYDAAKIMGQIDTNALTKPTVSGDDSTLTAAAASAANGAVADAARGSSEADAKADIVSNESSLKSAAGTAANSKVTELLAKQENKTVLENEAKRIAQEAHPSAEISNVAIKTKADASLDVAATLGEPTLSCKDAQVQKASATNAAFSSSSLVWSPDADTFALTLGSATSSSASVATVGTAVGNSLTLAVHGAGTTEMAVPYQFNWKATGGKALYDYSYDLSYTPQYSYDACTYAYEFTYTYAEGGSTTDNVEGAVSGFSLNEKPAGDLSEATATPSHTGVEADFTSDYTPSSAECAGSYTYNLEVKNLFSNASVETRTHAFTGESDNGAFTYHDGKKTVAAFAENDFADAAAALSFLGEPTVGTAQGFAVAYDKTSGNVEVTPQHATALAGESITLTWTLPDSTQVVHTVTAVVNPLDIAYDIAEQPFRLEGSQQEHVLKQANDSVRAVVKTATGEDIASDYYSVAEFTDYDDTGAGQEAAEVTFAHNVDAADDYADYKITDPGSVNIAPMAHPTWNETNLKLAATNGMAPAILTSENAVTQWINSVPTASWDTHRLAYATEGVPTAAEEFDASVLSGGDGVHDVTMYAMDEETDVVCEVEGVAYMLDTLAPVLQGAEASAPQKSATFGGILFGDSSINVDFTVVDRVNDNQGDSQDDLAEVKSSGVNSGQTTASYTDAETGQADIPAQLSGEAPNYSFTIEGDRDVPASSIKVHALDNAGNVLDTTANQARDIPMEYIRLVSDASAPVISVGWDTYDARNGRYYQTNRTMTITIEEAFFNYVRDYENNQVITTVYQNGEAAIAVHPSDFTEVAPNVWTYSLSFTTDADWDVTAPSVYDIIGRSASAAGDSFTVDKTSPTMEVSFDNNGASNGKYYNAARTATVTVTERNFSGDAINVSPTAHAGNGDTVGQPSVSGWSSSGDVHTATVTFPGEGVYAMTIDGRDLADNVLASYSCEEFVVDTVAPEIDLGASRTKGRTPTNRRPSRP